MVVPNNVTRSSPAFVKLQTVQATVTAKLI